MSKKIYLFPLHYPAYIAKIVGILLRSGGGVCFHSFIVLERKNSCSVVKPEAMHRRVRGLHVASKSAIIL